MKTNTLPEPDSFDPAFWPEGFWDQKHVPVLLPEVLRATQPIQDAVVVDCTFGAGGYSKALLKQGAGRVIALDMDPLAQKIAEEDFASCENFDFIHGNFAHLAELLSCLPIKTDPVKPDAIILDLGVSSMQLEQAERGFSFKRQGPLDMRMDTSSPWTAADLVNSCPEEELAHILFTYGEERKSRSIARAIAKRRSQKAFRDTQDLANLIRNVIGYKRSRKGLSVRDPATRSFQAIRIAVNRELEHIHAVLEQTAHLLPPGGRLVVVTFHSLEDRIVKQFLAGHSGQKTATVRHRPQHPDAQTPALFDLQTRKGIQPSAYEIEHNPRARSSRLRAATRTQATGSQATGPQQEERRT